MKTWASLETLTASDLNAEYNNILNYLNSGNVILGGTLAVTGTSTLTGNVGIGMVPVNVLDITQTQNATSISDLFNDSTGTAAACAWALTNHNGLKGSLTLYGSGFTSSGVARQDGLALTAAGAGGLTLATTSASAQVFIHTNSALRFAFDANGNLTDDVTGTTVNGAQPAIDNHAAAAVRADGCIHASKSAGIALEVNRTTDGTITNFRSAGAIQGSISISGATTSYNTSSDMMLKDDIQPANDVGSLIDAAPVKQFTWKVTGQAQAAGFVAQDLTSLSASVPGLVNQRDDGMLEYDPSKLVPILFKEIQSLRGRLAKAGIP